MQHQHSEVSQLTAQAPGQQTVGACRETLRQANVAVVRHVPVDDSGGFHVAAFVLDTGLPCGTRLYTWGQLRMAEEGGTPAEGAQSHGVADPGHTHGRHSYNTPRWGLVTPDGLVTSVPAGPIKVTDAELLKIFFDLKSVDVLDGVEPGSHGDAILAAYARTVLQRFGVQLTEERA
ncbi:hypothetical protein [Cupriavidus sp. Marseille-Q8015]